MRIRKGIKRVFRYLYMFFPQKMNEFIKRAGTTNVSGNIGQEKSSECSARRQWGTSGVEVESPDVAVVRMVITQPYGTFGIWIALRFLLNCSISRTQAERRQRSACWELLTGVPEGRRVHNQGLSKMHCSVVGVPKSHLTVLWPGTLTPAVYGYHCNQTLFLQLHIKLICKARHIYCLKTQFTQEPEGWYRD